MSENENARPSAKRAAKAPLYRDDSETVPTKCEDRNFLYLAKVRPEMSSRSGQWELTVPFQELDRTWEAMGKAVFKELKDIPVVKCPTLGKMYQDHKGHHENFYRETPQKEATIALYVDDATSINLLRKTFKAVKELFNRAKIGFVLHEQIITKRKAAFVFVDEFNKLKFSEPLYASFCKRNQAAPQMIKPGEKAKFFNKYAGKYEWMDLPERFVILDTETTGMDYVQGSITEVGAIVVQKSDMSVVARFAELVDIGELKVDKFITGLTGITNELLKEQGKPMGEVTRLLRAFVQDMPIVAHNARFDKGFVDMGFMKSRQPMLKNRWIDSIDILHTAMPDRPSYSLSSLCNELLDDFVQQHRAMADVNALLELLKEVNERCNALVTDNAQTFKNPHGPS